MAEIKVIEGTKIDEAEAAKLDPGKMGISMTATPHTPEVEGQALLYAYTRCPWCGHVGRSVVSTSRYIWYRCGGCGQPFRA
jgi:DNA-directed RNA polymerase subunit RPC12/RpoP